MSNTIQTNITSLDFEARKESLKNFLKTNTEFKDFDYEGSTMNILVQLLAFNSYQDSFLLNMVSNESYLDTAQLRENLVSKAKALNYIPKSARAATATVRLTFNPGDDPQSIVIPRGTRFYNTIDGITYNFVTLDEYSVNKLGNTYERVVTLYDGDLVRNSYIYSEANGNVKFHIPNDNVDIDKLKVWSRPNANSSVITPLVRITNITDITRDSYGYYVEEDINKKYAIYFGDNILGKKPANNSIITVESLVVSAGQADGITNLYNDGTSGYNIANTLVRYTPSNVTVLNIATGGSPKESIESIRYNAPRFYERQGRLVTSEDYKSFILEKFPDITSLAFWGGEENDPPIYGKVFISAKPESGYALTQIQKEEIIYTCNKYNVQTIEPLVVDPNFVYISPTILVRFDPTKTTLSADQIHAKLVLKLQAYETNTLGVFDSGFRFSPFLNLIDGADSSIISNETSILVEKRFTPIINSNINYIVNFNRPILYPYSGYRGSVTSSGFVTPRATELSFFDDDGLGNLRLYYIAESGSQTGSKIYINEKAGTIDYNAGIVTIKELIVTSLEGQELSILIAPQEKDIVPKKNEIILISNPKMSIYNTITEDIAFFGSFETLGTTTSLYNDISSNIVY